MDENCSVLDTKLDGWEEIVNGNLTASYNAARAFCAKLRKGSAIVMTGSCLVYFARPGYRLYAISKAGISASTRQLALELAPNVRANCVAPFAVDTAFWRGGTGRTDENQNPRIDFVKYVKAVPLARTAEAKDVSGPILFLLSFV